MITDVTLEQFLFWLFSFAACGGALMVVATQNVVRMAFWLVISLGSVSALFFLLHADFLGAAQLLIYVGGTVVVLVFGVMLTASGPYLKIQTSPGELFLGLGVGLVLLALLIHSVCSTEWTTLAIGPNRSPAQEDARELRNRSLGTSTLSVGQIQSGRTGRHLGLGFLGLRTDRDLGKTLPARLTPGYLLPFEIISVHLLVVLVGAAYLARAKRRSTSVKESVS
jgi:NADH:ubiquinone oxidoreductase subunit 6 (subunit J)